MSGAQEALRTYQQQQQGAYGGGGSPGSGYNQYQQPPPQQQQQQQYGHNYGQQQAPPGAPQQQQHNSSPYGFNVPVPHQSEAERKREEELRNWFAAVDQKGTGRIDAESLRAALSSSGAEFKASTAERLIRMFDKDSTGFIEFNEFKAAHQFIQQMATGFRQRDADNSGVLEGPEVRQALALSGYHLSDSSFQLLMKKFGKRGGLDFGSYIDLSIMLGSSARVFGFYDRNRSGLVTFDFNTFFVALLASTV